ncbi:MAG: GatB/YqeY domain-containing protein [Alphaproteobacteria bacterium]|nr:GatB/YqeY domain-containing protein [Alphaproteobacteria bacterium]
MLRQKFQDALKEAMKAGDGKRVSTLRLILAALKDKDIAARDGDKREGIPEDKIVALLQAMVAQRKESIVLYQKGNRADLVASEQAEIAVIEGFLPKQMDASATEAAVQAAIAESGAAQIRDMGKVMGVLRGKFAGQMDFARAGEFARKALGG